MKRPKYEKTSAIFEDTFNYVHQELRDKNATIDELGFHSANAIVIQIIKQLYDEIPAPEDSPPGQPSRPLSPDSLPTVIPGAVNEIHQADPKIEMLMQTTMASVEEMRLKIEGNENNMLNGYGTIMTKTAVTLTEDTDKVVDEDVVAADWEEETESEPVDRNIDVVDPMKNVAGEASTAVHMVTV